MTHGELERLFDRYRRDGDVGALEQVFDRTSRELMGIALHLVRDATQAEDLVQETFITAIERATSFDAARPLVPWLIGILTVCARRERRRSARVIEPSRLHERDAEQPERGALGSELASVLQTAFERVPGNYREVLELHLNRDMRPAEIATALDRAPGTVRVQLHRGLEMLRRALPEGIGLGVGWEFLGQRGTEAVKDAVLVFGRHEAPRLALQTATAATAPAASSFLLVKAIGALALALIGYFGIRALVEPTPLEPVHLGVSPASPDAGAGRVGDASPSDSGRVELAASAERESARTTLEAGVDLGTGAGAAREPGVWLSVTLKGVDKPARNDLSISLRPTDPRIPRRAFGVAPSLHFQLDVTSWYRPGGSDPREFLVEIDHPAWVLTSQSVFVLRERVEGMDLDAARVDLALTMELQVAQVIVSGRVVAPPHDVASARDDAIYIGLFRLDGGTPRIAPEEALVAATNGAFRLRAAQPGPHLLVAVHESARVFVERLDLDEGGELEHGTIHLDLGEELSGRVLYQDNAPAANAHIEVGASSAARSTHSMHGQPLVWVDGRFERATRELRADAEGRFTVGALSRGTYALRTRPGYEGQSALSLGTSIFTTTLVNAPNGAVELRLQRFEVVVHVASDGTDVPGAEVRVGDDENWRSARTDTRGRLVLSSRGSPMEFDVRVSAAGHEPRAVHVDLARTAPGATLEVELVRGAAPCQLVFVSPGVDFTTFWVELTPSSALSANERAALGLANVEVRKDGTLYLRLDAEGRARDLVSAGSYMARVVRTGARLTPDPDADPYALAIAAVLEITVPEGGELRVPFTIERGGRLRLPTPLYVGKADDLNLVLRRVPGDALDVEFTTFVARRDARAGNTKQHNRIKKGWTSLSEVLRPGIYVLEISDGLGAVTTEAVTIEAGVETVLEIKF